MHRPRPYPAILLALALVLAAPAGARAQERWAVTEFVLGTTCAVLNLAYGPIKVVFAALGGVTGSAAWALTGGDGEVARAIIQPALRGDYMVRPQHLTGDEPLEFYGRDPQPDSGYW